MSVLFYRRPDYLAKSSGPLNQTKCQAYVERAKKSERAIPKGLSFEDIIENRSLPPCSLPDFMDYLVYVEMNAENLQFYLWYQDYVRRWDTKVSKNDKALSPEWDHAEKEVPELIRETETAAVDTAKARTGIARGKEFKKKLELSHKPSVDGNTGMRFLMLDGNDSQVSKPARVAIPEASPAMSFGGTDSLSATGQAWEAFSIQPNRAEINQVILHYLSFDSPRELNLSHKDRVATLDALQHTTHPSALLPALRVVEVALRGQSHPNFIRWSICNGNKPRVFFVRTMGIQHTIFGFATAIPLVLSHASRWWRLLAAPNWFIGLSTLIAAYKGVCVILHKSHQRNLRPWEDTSSTISSATDIEMGSSRTKLTPRTVQVTKQLSDGTVRHISPFITKNKRGSCDTEDWERTYTQKSMLKKVFDKTTWTENETLRVLQDRIVLGANIWSLILTIILTVIFTALPKGNFY